LAGFTLIFSSGEDIESPVSKDYFWRYMGYFLRRTNEKWFADIKRKRDNG